VKALNVLDDTLKTHENTDLTEITQVMQGILDEARLLPKELPVMPEPKEPIDNTKQFQELTKAIQAVEKVVKAHNGATTQPSTSSITSVANSVTSVNLLATNTSRRMATFYNDDASASVYLKLGATASSSSFTIKIPPAGYYELPNPVYTGVIDAIATAATGSMRISEL